MLPAARAAMADGFALSANPSSPHADGRRARAAIEDARARIKAALGWRHDLIFTGGATEAAALALARGRMAGVVIRSAVEHDAVRRAAPDATVIPVGGDGLVDPDTLAAHLRDRPGAVVAVQHVNSETGVIQPVAPLRDVAAAAGATLFVDCAQSAGKLPLPDADLIALSAHKLGGPPGVGALLVRDLSALLPTGGQEMGYRGGTENLPAISGFAAAVESAPPTATDPAPWLAGQAGHRAWLDGEIAAGGGRIVCAQTPRSPLIAACLMPGLSATAQLIRFDAAGFSVSAGSACASGSMKPSPVLAALDLPPRDAACVIRISFGRTTTRAEVEAFAMLWRGMAAGGRG